VGCAMVVGTTVLSTRRLGVAPVVEPPHDEHPEDHLDGRARSPVRAGVGEAAGEIRARLLEEGIIVEEPIQFPQLGLEVEHPLRHEGEQINGRVAVDQHKTAGRRGKMWNHHVLPPHHEPGFAPPTSTITPASK